LSNGNFIADLEQPGVEHLSCPVRDDPREHGPVEIRALAAVPSFVLCLTLLACGGSPPAGPAAPAADGAEARDATAEPLDRWTKLGERSLDRDGKRDSIRASADEGSFSSVRFVLRHGKLEITSVTVTFGDGTTATLAKRLTFGKGTVSRAIDLPGGKRVIRQVEFAYSAASNTESRSTQLEVWAQ
jgi:hypothetical protein